MITKQEGPKNYHISGRVSQEVYNGLLKHGQALKLGRSGGVSVLVSLGATMIYQVLVEVEADLKNLNKGMEDFFEIKDRWLFKAQLAPFTQLLKDPRITENLPEEIMISILRLSNGGHK